MSAQHLDRCFYSTCISWLFGITDTYFKTEIVIPQIGYYFVIKATTPIARTRDSPQAAIIERSTLIARKTATPRAARAAMNKARPLPRMPTIGCRGVTGLLDVDALVFFLPGCSRRQSFW